MAVERRAGGRERVVDKGGRREERLGEGRRGEKEGRRGRRKGGEGRKMGRGRRVCVGGEGRRVM